MGAGDSREAKRRSQSGRGRQERSGSYAACGEKEANEMGCERAAWSDRRDEVRARGMTGAKRRSASGRCITSERRKVQSMRVGASEETHRERRMSWSESDIVKASATPLSETWPTERADSRERMRTKKSWRRRPSEAWVQERATNGERMRNELSERRRHESHEVQVSVRKTADCKSDSESGRVVESESYPYGASAVHGAKASYVERAARL